VDVLEYVGGALADWDKYLILLVLSAMLHWVFLLRRRTLGFFDPLFVILLGSIFGWTIVWFMYLRGDIEGVYAASFTVTELAFYAGLCTTRRIPRAPPPRAPSGESPGFAISIFAVAAFIHIGTTLTTWSIAGIPLFRVSRLGAFVESGGLGVLERLVDAGGAIALFTSLYLAIGNSRTRKRFVYYGFFAWYSISIGLSGSKSAFLVIGQCVFAVAFLYTSIGRREGSFWGGKAGKAFIVISTAFAVLVLIVQQDVDFASALTAFAFRLLSFGDIYINAYPGATIEQLRGDNALVGLFGGVLSTFRLFPADQLHVNIGYQFSLLNAPNMDYLAGGNPRHSIFGYHYFGHWAFLFSFLLGVLTSRVHRAFYFSNRRDFFHTLVSYLAYVSLVSVSVDFDYSLSRIANMLIALCLILPPALLLFPQQPLFRLSRPARVAR
jgi:hypothetical protein